MHMYPWLLPIVHQGLSKSPLQIIPRLTFLQSRAAFISSSCTSLHCEEFWVIQSKCLFGITSKLSLTCMWYWKLVKSVLSLRLCHFLVSQSTPFNLQEKDIPMNLYNRTLLHPIRCIFNNHVTLHHWYAAINCTWVCAQILHSSRTTFCMHVHQTLFLLEIEGYVLQG